MYFKINIDNVKQAIDSNSKGYKSLKSKNNDVYRNLFYSKESWSDINTNKFIDDAKRNSLNIDEFITTLETYNGYLENLLSNINAICKRYTSANIKTIKFDDSTLASINAGLDNIVSYMNNVIRTANSISNLDVDSSFSPAYAIRRANNVKNLVSELKEDLRAFTTDIKTSTEGFKDKTGKLNLNLKVNKYKATMKTMDLGLKLDNLDYDFGSIRINNEVNNKDIQSMSADKINSYDSSYKNENREQDNINMDKVGEVEANFHILSTEELKAKEMEQVNKVTASSEVLSTDYTNFNTTQEENKDE